MGISYIPRTCTGIRLDGLQQADVKGFLDKHGYPISEDEFEEIEDNGWEQFSTLKDVEWSVDCMDGWSGHGWTIGFDGNSPEHMEIMQKAFPNAKVEVFEYVQLM